MFLIGRFLPYKLGIETPVTGLKWQSPFSFLFLKNISMHLFFPPYDQINSDDQREAKDGSDDYGGDIRESV